MPAITIGKVGTKAATKNHFFSKRKPGDQLGGNVSTEARFSEWSRLSTL